MSKNPIVYLLQFTEVNKVYLKSNNEPPYVCAI